MLTYGTTIYFIFLFYKSDTHLVKMFLTALKIEKFPLKKETNEFFRFVRLRQTGYSWYLCPRSHSYILRFPFIEFFGKLKELKSQ